MNVRLARISLIALIMLIAGVRADVALATNDTISRNVTPHSLESATWSVIAGSNSSATATGNAYGPITPFNSSCGTTDFYLTTDGNGWSNGNKRVRLQQSTSQLTVGMTVTGTGINSSGINTIASFSSGNRVTLTLGPNTSPDYTTLKFSTPCASASSGQYFNILNVGTVDLISLSILQTVTTTNGNSITLQSCSTAWDEVANTCSGVITTIMTTIGSGIGANSPQTTNWVTPIAAGASIRLRMISTESGKTTTISVWVTNSDIRSTTNTNA